MAEYNLFCSVKEESLLTESQSSVTATFRWTNVEKTLEIPPLSSAVCLVNADLVVVSPTYRIHGLHC